MTPGCGADCPCQEPRRFGQCRTVFSTGERTDIRLAPSMREEENFMRYLFGAVLCVAGAWLMVRSAKKLGEYPAYPVMR